jgi:HEAT repeat protein
MQRKWRLVIILAIALLAGGIALRMQHLRNHRLIQGKTEAEWLAGIKTLAELYAGINFREAESAETEQWRALGPEGIQILMHGLNTGNGPLELWYARIYPALPGFLRQRLSPPADSYSVRFRATAMLMRLGNGARDAVPAMIKELKRQRNDGVQMNLLTAFNFKDNLAEGMDREKTALLPVIIACLQSPDGSIRNNAALALGSYPDRAGLVAPILLQAMKDGYPNVRVVAASALNHVSPRAAATPEVVETLIEFLKNPNRISQAQLAADVLGKIGPPASNAVPALIEWSHATNELVASHAIIALKKIDPQAAAGAGIK